MSMAQDHDTSVEAYRTPRALLVAVIGMGVLIVAGTAVLIGVILHRMNGGGHQAPPGVPLTDAAPMLSAPALSGSVSSSPTSSAVMAGAGGPVAHLPLGVDEHLLGLTRVQDGLLAVQVSGPRGERVLLWQVGSGQVRPGLDTAAAQP